jgi:hypothetical protein
MLTHEIQKLRKLQSLAINRTRDFPNPAEKTLGFWWLGHVTKGISTYPLFNSSNTLSWIFLRKKFLIFARFALYPNT